MIQSQYFIFNVFCACPFILPHFHLCIFWFNIVFHLCKNLFRFKITVMGNFTFCIVGFAFLKCRRDVITAVLHSVGMKHRSLASASENACAWSGERFLFERAVIQGRWNYRLENVVFSFVICVLLCTVMWTSLNLSRIASFKRSWELLLEVSTWLYVLSITLELKIKRIVKPNVFFTIVEAAHG